MTYEVPGLLSFHGLMLRHPRARHPVGDEVMLGPMDGRIRQGQRVFVVGDVGVGKTAWLSLVLGWRVPCDGQVVLDGHALNPDVAQRWRSLVGWVPQRPRWFQGANVFENVLAGCRSQGVQREEAVAWTWDMLSRLGCERLAMALPGALNGAEQQRLAVARALVGRPAWLFLDAPLACMDAASRASVIRALTEAVEGQGAGWVWLEREGTERPPLAEVVWRLHGGQFHVEEGV